LSHRPFTSRIELVRETHERIVVAKHQLVRCQRDEWLVVRARDRQRHSLHEYEVEAFRLRRERLKWEETPEESVSVTQIEVVKSNLVAL
jgi:hypothetical protein